MTTQNGDRNVLTHLLIIFSNSLLNLDFGRPNMHSLLKAMKFSTLDVVLVKSKGKIVKNTCRCTKILYQ